MSIKHVNPEELRNFLQSHHEDSFVLVDVRQPEEYHRGHIPGARLMPLPELVQSLDRLPADKTLIFYCHGGGRSMAAAVMAAEESIGRDISNLTGGMLAWDGARLSDFPQVRLFSGQPSAQMFKTAVDMEKGAQRFYEAVAREQGAQPWARIFARLALAEEAHARTVYAFWRAADPALDEFESVYDRLSGEVLEGGMTLQAALQRLAELPPNDACLRLTEMALQIEYAAYDLYRTLADQADADEARRRTFITLAQAEKAHMQSLTGALAECSG